MKNKDLLLVQGGAFVPKGRLRLQRNYWQDFRSGRVVGSCLGRGRGSGWGGVHDIGGLSYPAASL